MHAVHTGLLHITAVPAILHSCQNCTDTAVSIINSFMSEALPTVFCWHCAKAVQSQTYHCTASLAESHVSGGK